MTAHLLRDLDNLKKQILTLGSMVEEATNKAITALVDRRSGLAEEVMRGDRKIDIKELEVEDICLKILALHQPVAGDLRFIVTALKVNNDLERIGDLAVNIAERTMYLTDREPITVPKDFPIMAAIVRDMLCKSLDSLVKQDALLAKAVCEKDSEVDAIYKKMWVVLQDEMLKDPSIAKRASHTLSVSYQLERIADHATNIAEDVIFLVEGEVIRHRVKDFSI